MNKVAQLSEEECAKGLIAASAGNHAQGVAFAGRKRTKCTSHHLYAT